MRPEPKRTIGTWNKVAVGSALAIFFSVWTAGCDSKVCEKAAKKYAGCVEKILGKEMAAMAKSKEKEGIAACRKDSKTQKMYKKCLPVEDCQKFMDCLEEYARKHGP